MTRRTHPLDEIVPEEAQIFSWIESVVAAGLRRPGHAADAWSEGWAAERFRELGLRDVQLEPVPLEAWEFRAATLTVWASGAPSTAVTLEAFALPYTLPTPGVEAELTDLGARDVAGRFAVEQVPLTTLAQKLARALATSAYDPGGELETLVQTLPTLPLSHGQLDPVVAAGAAGYIGVLSGFPWDTHDYYFPYDGVERPIPAVWIRKSAGRRLAELRAQGPVTGRLVVDAACRPATSHNVVGALPGASDEWVVVGSHHDAPWASAVEDASGIALVLAQAAYWSRVPEAERPHNLLFLLNAGHMVGGAGITEFLRRHHALLERVVLELHLEHAAQQCRAEDDRLVPTGEPEVRWWFTTREPGLEKAVADALAAEDLRRSLVFRPDVFSEHPPTDGGFFHLRGVPLVNYLTAPMYLFDSCDTLDKIHRPSLVPVTRAAVRIVASLAGRTAAELRGSAPRR